VRRMGWRPGHRRGPATSRSWPAGQRHRAARARGAAINPAASDHPTTMSRSSCRVAHRPSAQSTRAVINEHHRTASVARRTRRSDVATSLEAAQASAVATVFDNRMSAAEAPHDQHDAP